MKTEDIIKGNNVKDILKFLETTPVDELYTIQELNEKFGVPESTIKSSQTLQPHRTKFLGKNYFGSQDAITGFEKKIAEGV